MKQVLDDVQSDRNLCILSLPVSIVKFEPCEAYADFTHGVGISRLDPSGNPIVFKSPFDHCFDSVQARDHDLPLLRKEEVVLGSW